jgi:hypothetical protein
MAEGSRAWVENGRDGGALAAYPRNRGGFRNFSVMVAPRSDLSSKERVATVAYTVIALLSDWH